MKIRATKMMSIIPRSLLMACMITMMLAADDVHRQFACHIEDIELQHHRGQTVPLEYEFGQARITVKYALCVPKGFEAGKKTPLVVALHGLNDTPKKFAPCFQSAADEYGYLVLCPMGFNKCGWYGAQHRITPDALEAMGDRLAFFADQIEQTILDAQGRCDCSEKDVMNVINKLKQHRDVEVDECRTYLLGYSMGGAGAWHLGMLKQWAAVGFVAPAVPNALSHPEEVVRDLREINRPMICFQGSNDPMVDAKITRRIFEAAGAEYNEIPCSPFSGHSGVWKNGTAHKIFQFFGTHRNDTTYETSLPFEKVEQQQERTRYAHQFEEMRRSTRAEMEERKRAEAREELRIQQEQQRAEELKQKDLLRIEENRRELLRLKAAEDADRQRQILADEELARSLDKEYRQQLARRQQRLKAEQDAAEHASMRAEMEERKRAEDLWRKAEEAKIQHQLKAAEEEAKRQQQLKAAEEEAKRQHLINEQIHADEELARKYDMERLQELARRQQRRNEQGEARLQEARKKLLILKASEDATCISGILRLLGF